MDQSPGCVRRGVWATGVIAAADAPIAADVNAFMEEATAEADAAAADADEQDDVGVTAELTAAIEAGEGDAMDILPWPPCPP